MERIGEYTVERVLGEGGMGTVYLARSRGGRRVAVKVAKPELARDAGFRERFRAEITAARAVGGFHTAPVVDADPDAPAPWLATAYIPGPHLAELLTAQGPMDEAGLRRLGLALAEALGAIHACGLVHRDLKPGNIIMAEDGPRVVDFGIARAVEGSGLTVTGIALGTPGFLAPEQAEGLPVTGAADIFALGAVLVAAAGGSAFGQGTPMGLMYRSVHQEADLSAVPSGLRPTVAACLAKDPGQRPTAANLLDLLALPQAASPSYAYTPTVVAPPPPAAAPSPMAPAAPSPFTPAPAPPPYAPSVRPTVTAPSPYPPGAVPPPPPGGFGPPGVFGPPEPAAVEGQEFLAMDNKNAIVADVHGISLGINGRPSDYPWYAVRAVTHTRSGRGFSLNVTVHLHDGRSQPCRVTAQDEDELSSWIQQLALVVNGFVGPLG
ncbi:serine/threonine-protein kinase [Streptomyces cyslabdanicus]|uniref:serine/threonine-protein kinase n=1 Tax=Streptomyces cyslabdanicus TaxID=1470456 RepID=UPI004044C67E